MKKQLESGRTMTQQLQVLVVVVGEKKGKVLQKKRFLNMYLFKGIDELKPNKD